MSRERVEVTVDKEKIKGYHFLPTGALRPQAVLFLHGWTGHPNDRAAAFLAGSGFHVMTFSFRGHNDSDGDIRTITVQKSLDDAVAAYDHFTSIIPTRTPIIVVGSSYGSFIASLLSVERSVHALSLRVPANYQDEEHDLPKWERGSEVTAIAEWRLMKLDASATASLRAIRSFNGNIQIFEAELDDVVPSQGVKNYAAAVSDPFLLDYRLMKDWPHSLAGHEQRSQEYETLLLDWLNRL